jgi:hypothetical protein
VLTGVINTKETTARKATAQEQAGKPPTYSRTHNFQISSQSEQLQAAKFMQDLNCPQIITKSPRVVLSSFKPEEKYPFLQPLLANSHHRSGLPAGPSKPSAELRKVASKEELRP